MKHIAKCRPTCPRAGVSTAGVRFACLEMFPGSVLLHRCEGKPLPPPCLPARAPQPPVAAGDHSGNAKRQRRAPVCFGALPLQITAPLFPGLFCLSFTAKTRFGKPGFSLMVRT